MTTRVTAPERRGRAFDTLLACGVAFVLAWTTGLILTDLLPPAWEQSVAPLLVYALLLFLLVASATAAWSLTRYLVRGATVAHLWWGLALGMGTLALFAGISLTQGVQIGATITSLPWAVLLPFAVLLSSPANRTYYGAAWRGALIAGIAAFCYFCLYCLFVGFEGGYLVGDIGPGVAAFARGVDELGLILAFFFLAAWPPICLLLAGALGGILGEKIRRVSQRSYSATEYVD